MSDITNHTSAHTNSPAISTNSTSTSTASAFGRVSRFAIAAAALVGSATGAAAQSATERGSGFEFLVSSGSLVPTGSQRDALKRADQTVAQLSYAVTSNIVFTSSVGWARSRDIASAGSPKLDVYSYDVGAELRADRWLAGKSLSFTPFAGAGVGGRSYDYRKLEVDATHNLASYGGVGGELGYRRVRMRIEARDYVSGFKRLMADGSTGRRNDVSVMAGFRIAAH